MTNSLSCAACSEPVDPATLVEMIVKGKERPLYPDMSFPRLRPTVAHLVFHSRCLRAIPAIAALVPDKELAAEDPQPPGSGG